jgi:hypothetical protein
MSSDRPKQLLDHPKREHINTLARKAAIAFVDYFSKNWFTKDALSVAHTPGGYGRNRRKLRKKKNERALAYKRQRAANRLRRMLEAR